MKTKANPPRRPLRGVFLYLFYFLFLLYLLPSPVSAQTSGRGTLDGVVTESDGTPVRGAQVVMQSSAGKRPRGVKTDTRGRFAFRSIRHGLYDVRATFQGRSSEWMRNIVLKSGTRVTLTLVLPEKPPPAPAP